MDSTDAALTRKELREEDEQRQQAVGTPVRTREGKRAGATISIFVGIALLIALAWYLTTSGINKPQALPDAGAHTPAQVFGIDEVLPFPTNAAGGPLSVAVIGDSVAGNMYKALAENRTASVTPFDVSWGGCGIFDAAEARAADGFMILAEQRCADWKDKLRAVNAQQQIDVYILHNLWDANDQHLEGQWVTGCTDPWVERYTAQLELFVSIGAEQQREPLILLSNDHGIEDNVLLNSERLKCKTTVEDAVIAAHSNVRRLDLEGTLCHEGVCATKLPDGAEIYTDGTHFGPEALALLAPWLQNEMAKGLAAVG